MNIGIYGGAFNPPHIGHISVAKLAFRALELDKLLIVPSADSPHKPRDVLTPSDEARLRMLRLAFAGFEGLEISRIELDSPGPSYTSKTLRRLRDMYPRDRLIFIMGSDMLLSFEKWYEPERIAELAELAYLSRGDLEPALARCESMIKQRFGKRPIRIENRYIDISSTQIRKFLPLGCADGWLQPEVHAYIVEHGLYDTPGPSGGFEQLRDWSLRRVSEERGLHVLGCVDTSSALAERWGADTELARAAAVLHDVTKDACKTEQLKLCAKYGIIPDDIELENAKLLHSLTGAAVAAHLGQPEEVCSAIRWHTTGRPGMTLLEKIIYLADYIEPRRDFEGVERLRTLALVSLDGALEMALSSTIAGLNGKMRAVHPRTEQALEFLRAARKGEDFETRQR